MSFFVPDWYWIVGDTSPGSQVFSSKAGVNGYVANNAAGFLTWLADPFFGAAGGDGSVFNVNSAADNGSGKTRLTLDRTNGLVTGQRFNFGPANGNQQITVIDSTHIDLTGLNFSSYVTTAFMYGATIIDTNANLSSVIGKSALSSYKVGSTSLSLTANTTLANPLPARLSVVPNNPWVLTLPPMNAPNSAPLGWALEIRNEATTSKSFDLNDNAGNYLCTIGPNRSVILTVATNATIGGTFFITTQTDNIFPRRSWQVRGLRAANNAGAPNTKMDITFISVNAPGNGINDPTAGLYAAHGTTKTCDVGAAGPAVNSRDQAGAFSANSFIHFYAIFSNATSNISFDTIASASDPDTGPTLPTGYQYWAYLFSVRFDGSSHLFPVHVRGSFVAYDAPRNDFILNGGTAVVETAVDVSARVPAIATTFVMAPIIALESTGGCVSVLELRFISGSGYNFVIGTAPAGGVLFEAGSTQIWPNVGQQFYYLLSDVSGTADLLRSAYAFVCGYYVPNGDSA